jgi:hypothetical protein
MFEENVHSFPERVIKNLDHFLMHEGILRCWVHGVGTFRAGQREGHRTLTVRFLQSGPHFRIAFGRAESHYDVFGTKDSFEPRPKKNREIERGQRPLAYNHGMNELHRDMLCIGGVGPASEGEQTPAAQKSFRQFAAGFRKARRFAGKETLEKSVPLQQKVFNLAG